MIYIYAFIIALFIIPFLVINIFEISKDIKE